MNPTVGRLVHYCIAEHDVARIRRRRAAREFIRLRDEDAGPIDEDEAARVVPDPEVGQVCAMLIVRVHDFDGTVNGQVFLDGFDVLWVLHVQMSGMEVPGTWRWPDSLTVTFGLPPGALPGAEP